MILRHLKTHGYITPAIAMTTYGFYRLAAIVHDLRKSGYEVTTDLKRDAVGHTYAHYNLKAHS
jgi:hypothetical protein